MKKYKISIVRPACGDWVALYVDGKLVSEGHSLRIEDIFDALADDYPNDVEHIEISDERAEYGFNAKLEDLLVATEERTTWKRWK